MFSFSFERRNSTLEVERHIRRLIDLTRPNIGSPSAHERSEDRCNRVIPVLVCPWKNESPLADAAIIAITKDVSSRGLSLILKEPFEVPTVAVGFWLDDQSMVEPWFFLGSAHRLELLGGQFWTLAVEFTEFANAQWRNKLRSLHSLAQQLRPLQPAQ